MIKKPKVIHTSNDMRDKTELFNNIMKPFVFQCEESKLEPLYNRHKGLMRRILLDMFDYDLTGEFNEFNDSFTNDIGLDFEIAPKITSKHPMWNWMQGCYFFNNDHNSKYNYEQNFNPRDWVMVNVGQGPSHEIIEQALEDKLFEQLDDIYHESLSTRRTSDFTGGGRYGSTPINGAAKVFYIDRQYRNRGEHNDPTVVLGHAHTLMQLYGNNILEQAMQNLHFVNSSYMDMPLTVWDAISKHIKVEMSPLGEKYIGLDNK